MNSTWVIGIWVYCWDVPHCNITNLVQVAILITLLLINSSKEKIKQNNNGKELCIMSRKFSTFYFPFE